MSFGRLADSLVSEYHQASAFKRRVNKRCINSSHILPVPFQKWHLSGTKSDKTGRPIHRSWNTAIGKETKSALTICKGLTTSDYVADEQI